MKLSEFTQEKSSIGARVNKKIFDDLKGMDIPLSLVVEAGLIWFLKLSDEEKIIYLADNSIENTEISELKKSNTKWPDNIKHHLSKLQLPDTTVKALLIGSGIAAISVISSFLKMKKEL